MLEVDLDRLTHGKVRSLAGHPRGVEARQMYALDAAQTSGVKVVVKAPADLASISPSFVQGFMAGMVNALGREQLLERLDLSHLSPLLQEDFRMGLERLFVRKSIDRP